MPASAKTPEVNEELAQGAADRVVETHRRLAGWLSEGKTLAEVDRFVAQCLEDQGARSCFLGYKVPRSPAFPSHACLSVNECIVHGTAGYRTEPLARGDLLSVDIGVWYKGWIGDAAWTYIIGEATTEHTLRLAECGRACIDRGIEQLQPGTPLLEWAKAVQGCVEGEYGYHLVRGLGGHGIGRKLHGPPFVSNVTPRYPGEWPDSRTRLVPGMLLAVEPMLAVGTGDTRQQSNQWPIFSADGSLSVHYEHDVLITENGPRVLTKDLAELPDIVG